MPYIPAARRAQGGYSTRPGRAPEPRKLGPCGVCGEPSLAYFMVGARCPAHTPAATAGRPEPRPPAPVPPSPKYAPRVTAQRWPEDACVPCVHCGRPAAPVLAEAYGVVEHVACVNPPPTRNGVTVWREGDPEPWSRELIERRTREMRARHRGGSPNRKAA